MDIFFSNKKGHILLAAIIDSYWRQNDEGYLGRTKMQKIPYFVKNAGVSLPFKFEILHYGPYSSDVSTCLEELEADGIIEDRSFTKDKFSDYRITEKGNIFLEERKEVISDYKKNIDDVVGIFKKIGEKALELFSTIHFLFQEQKYVSSENLRGRVMKRFKQVKKDTFKEKVVSEAYEALDKVGLLKA